MKALSPLMNFKDQSHLYDDSCGYCAPDLYTFGDDYLVLPVDPVETFPYNYLVSLFTAPDMAQYLVQASVTEDVHALPIHLQRLISEAKEEAVLERIKAKQQSDKQQSELIALKRLQRVRDYVWARSSGDVANLMSALTELISDEDELESILDI